MTELPKLEVLLYYIIWISGICVSLFHLYIVGQVFDHSHHDQYHYEDFRKGWAILGTRYQDQADFEWNTWTALFIKLIPFLVINFLGAEYLKYKNTICAVPLWYIIVTISFVSLHFSLILAMWFILQTLIYIAFVYLKCYSIVWIISFIIIHFLKPEFWFSKTEDDQYLIMVSSSWMILRCISYSSEKLKVYNDNIKPGMVRISDAFVLLGYSLYLPTMFCGPFISFYYFNEEIKIKNKWTRNRIFKIFKNFAKSLFWYFFTLFALHFIYVNAILLRPDFVKHLLNWELAGLGIAMGHFFHLKYTVFYGLPCAWAQAEGYTTPHLPCCVSRVHLYSYMWRHFDHGLYQFLVRYIYVPIITRVTGMYILRKIVASMACFAFMFIWHKEHDYVFFWVLFNFISVTVELFFKQFCKLAPVDEFLKHNLSPQNQIRFQCFLAAPLHCFSMISNYFFIGNGMDIGLIYLKRIYYGSFMTKLTVLFFLYGAGQSAVATQKWSNQRTKS